MTLPTLSNQLDIISLVISLAIYKSYWLQYISKTAVATAMKTNNVGFPICNRQESQILHAKVDLDIKSTDNCPCSARTK
jgi:hypothetical protein